MRMDMLGRVECVSGGEGETFPGVYPTDENVAYSCSLGT